MSRDSSGRAGRPRVLELGSYIVPSYAGMLLAEQGFQVVKWTDGRDPILSLRSGPDLWTWVNYGKTVKHVHPGTLVHSWPDWRPDIVLDNIRPATLEKWGLDPDALAKEHGVIWVSMRDELGERSFDLLAQARSWMEYAPWVPFWAGDTAGGLWLAFKALAARAQGEVGHHVLGQASCLQKLVEGELVVDRPPGPRGRVPWETEPYHFDGTHAVVQFKGAIYQEPVRNRDWKMAHLWHENGRIRI
jgi:hypothetical protein